MDSEFEFAALTAQIESARAQLEELIAGPWWEDIAAAEANVRRLESQLKLAQVMKSRMLRLLKSRPVSDQEADKRSTARKSLRLNSISGLQTREVNRCSS